MSIAAIIVLSLIGLYLLWEIIVFILKYKPQVSFVANLYMTITRRGMKFMFGGYRLGIQCSARTRLFSSSNFLMLSPFAYSNPHCNPDGFVKRRRIIDFCQSIHLPRIPFFG